jgi:hypothetical protein
VPEIGVKDSTDSFIGAYSEEKKDEEAACSYDDDSFRTSVLRISSALLG